MSSRKPIEQDPDWEEFVEYEIPFRVLYGEVAPHVPYLKNCVEAMGVPDFRFLRMLAVDTKLDGQVKDYKPGLHPKDPGAYAARFRWCRKTDEQLRAEGLLPKVVSFSRNRDVAASEGRSFVTRLLDNYRKGK